MKGAKCVVVASTPLASRLGVRDEMGSGTPSFIIPLMPMCFVIDWSQSGKGIPIIRVWQILNL